jgi:hypothetical protein
MSRSAKQAFGHFREPLEANNHIYNKKTETIYCTKDCNLKTTDLKKNRVNSQGELVWFNHSKQIFKKSINNANLNINLITELDLTNVPVITDLSGNIPIVIDASETTPYLVYNEDPSGNLFGNSECDTTPFVDYMVPIEEK